MRPTFQGSLVALITPFKNGEIDEAKLRELVELHVKSGTDAIIPCGTTGESPTLSHPEHKRVVEIVIDAARGRVPVVAGTGSNSTAEALELTAHARKAAQRRRWAGVRRAPRRAARRARRGGGRLAARARRPRGLARGRRRAQRRPGGSRRP